MPFTPGRTTPQQTAPDPPAAKQGSGTDRRIMAQRHARKTDAETRLVTWAAQSGHEGVTLYATPVTGDRRTVELFYSGSRNRKDPVVHSPVTFHIDLADAVALHRALGPIIDQHKERQSEKRREMDLTEALSMVQAAATGGAR